MHIAQMHVRQIGAFGAIELFLDADLRWRWYDMAMTWLSRDHKKAIAS